MGEEIISWGKPSLFINDQPIAFDSCNLAVEEEEPGLYQNPFTVSELKSYSAELIGFDVGDWMGDKSGISITMEGAVVATFDSIEWRPSFKRVPRKKKKALKKRYGDLWKNYAPFKECEVTLSNKKERP